MGTRIQKENATNRALTLAKQKKGKWNKEVSVREKTFENKTANRKLGRHSTGLHCSSSHTKHQSHKCKKCDKSFGCAYSLWRHDIIHSDKRPYKCKYCGKSNWIVVNMEDSMNHLSSSANLKAKELGMQISLLVPHALHGLLLFRIVMQVRMSQKTAGFVKDHSVGKHSKTTMRRVHAY